MSVEALTSAANSDSARQASQYRSFVAVSPGLEALLEQELRELGIEGRSIPGGVECKGPVEHLWTIHHYSRLAESVRLRLRQFQSRSFAELERELLRLPWHGYLRPNEPYAVSVSCQGSRLYHTDAIAERVRRVVAQRIAQRDASASTSVAGDDLDEPHVEQKLQVRVHRNNVQVSIDASGGRLHRRGYRTHVGTAPLRETLAAAVVRMLDQATRGRTFAELWDPCCGSGTLLAEWLLLRQGAAAQKDRGFAFESWPIHRRDEYAAWCQKRLVPTAGADHLHALGTDSDPRAIDASRHNLSSAGLGEHCELICDDFRRAVTRVPQGAAVVSNLPYGVRLADKEHANQLFLKLDRLLLQRGDLRPAVVLTTFAPPQAAQCDWKALATFANGGLRVTAWGLALPSENVTGSG
ncbi:MAG TPA: hypothetical protein VKP30_28580 [Polyangiaceae bacterium]|nr:hypothetical protein [Polyangiaceae bacterium]